MIVLRAFKTELDLNNQQSSACVRHAGAARFAYNWRLVIDRDWNAAINLEQLLTVS